MYEDLIDRLRNESQNAIETCDFDFVIAWMQEAADAIEELQKAVNFHKFNSEFWEDKYNSLADEKWIPVTERLPEEWWPVLGLIKFHGKDEPPAQQVLWYLGNGHWREAWRGDMIENDVTHWMPLPEPPKEE